MACNSSACQSNCYKDEDEQQGSIPPETVKADAKGYKSYSTSNDHQNLCLKCKANEPISGGGSGDDGRLCVDCFRGNLFGKFRLAVTSNAMITPDDNVLVAFSGGPSSRVALQFVHEMQNKAQKNFDASRDRSLRVFGVGVAFLDESDLYPVPPYHNINKAIKDIQSVVSNLAPPTKELHVVPIEDVYSSDSCEGRGRLKDWVDSVSDVSGKEDLLLYLRMLSLQKVASKYGYNRIVLGTSTSRIACHVLSATVKGQGYSLPADIQYVDARWEVPVVLPLRDCLARELNMLCSLDGLKTVEVLNTPCSGINGLVSSFVTLLQKENPSRECTIVRTAGKLIPFHFNRIPEIDNCNVPLAIRRRQKRSNLQPNESMYSESFCSICNSPLHKSDLRSSSNPVSCLTSPDVFVAFCCSSCRFQILPKDPSSFENFYSLLPQPFVYRANNEKCTKFSLREQIRDCLLSDSEDES